MNQLVQRFAKLAQSQKHMIDSKYLSYILRHAPSAANVELDSNGYVAVDKLIDGIKQTGRHIDRAELEEIIAADSKRRFSFNDDHTKIRANYGHSVAVNLQLQAIAPPAVLYHGTAKKFLERIAAEGIKKQSRNFVHLSNNPQAALAVGARHGQADVLNVFAQEMYADGFSFYLSESGVWLTEFVPPQYVFQMDEAISCGCECPPFEMCRLTSRRIGIAGEIWVYDTGKSVESSRYRIIYENANARVCVCFDGVFPRVQGDVVAAAPNLPQVTKWIQLNKNFLLKLYGREGDYDIVDFLDEMQPVSSPKK